MIVSLARLFHPGATWEFYLKIACYVHPVLHPNGPNWDYPWFGILARLLRTLRGAHAIEGMLISKPWHHSLAGKDGTLSLLDGLLIGMVDHD